MNISNMKEKKHNSISEEKSSSDNKESIENKEKMEQNEILYKEDEINPSTNEEFQDRLSKVNQVKIPSKSTKVNDINQKEEKDEENEKYKIPTRKILFVIEEEVNYTKKKRKSRKAPAAFSKKNKHREIKGKNKIFAIKKVQKAKYAKKEITSFKSRLNAKKTIKNYIPHFLVWKVSYFNPNGPPSKEKRPYNRESLWLLFSIGDRVTSQNDDDDEKLTKEKIIVIKSMCYNHDKNIPLLQNEQYYESESYDSLQFMSTNCKTN